MKTIKYILIAFLYLHFSCNSNDEITETSDFDYIIFGHFFGFCGGDTCVQTYKLTNENLFEDTVKDYTGENVNFIALDDEKYQLTKDLINYFPTQLFTNENTFIGCPDCSDGGGLFIQYAKNGTIQTWRIDLFKMNTPEYLHEFIDKVQEKIKLINQTN